MPPDPLQDGNFNNLDMNDTGNKKGKGVIIVLVIILLLIVAVVAAIALDIGNVRNDHIMPYLRNAPLIGSLFTAEETDPTDEMTEEQMRSEIRNLRTQVDSLEAQRTDLREQLENANTRIGHLTQFELRWNEYRDASARFTQMLAHNAPNDFVEFFQDLVDTNLVPHNPAIVAEAYAEAREINAFNEELRTLVSTYNNMEESRAAEDLVRLRIIDTDLAVRLLRAMSPSRRALLFDEMEYSDSTIFAILLSTEPPTFAPLVPPPELPEIFPRGRTLAPPVFPDIEDDEEFEEIEEDEDDDEIGEEAEE